MKLLAAALLLIASATASAMAQAKPVETWECKEFIHEKTVIVIATVAPDRTSGTITVSGVTYETAFEVAGFNRRWDWGPDDRPTRYSFVIKPDGIGLYYDFSGASHVERANEVVKCRQR